MSRYSVECIVLKSLNYQDKDKIYTFFGKDKGKFVALAKGVRKISSRRAGNLDTSNHIKIGISEGSSGFKIVTEAKTINSFKNVKSRLKKSTQTYFVLELVHRFLEEGEKNDELFLLLLDTLNNLNSPNADSVMSTLYFEINLMRLMGYEMTFDKCFFCKRKYDGNWEETNFNLGVGGFVCDRCDGGIPIPKDVSEILRDAGVGELENDSLNAKYPGFSSDVLSADELVKNYIRGILEDNFRTERVFGP